MNLTVLYVLQQPFGGNLGEEKRKGIIKSIFVFKATRWDEMPKIRRDIDKFANRVKDVSWKQGVRWWTECLLHQFQEKIIAFKRMTIDVVGLIEPALAAGHKYCLWILDSYVRWPTVYLLKSYQQEQCVKSYRICFWTLVHHQLLQANKELTSHPDR